jgi:hypothetical protein
MGSKPPRTRAASGAPITFSRELKPGIEAGSYRVTVDHALTGMGADNDEQAKGYFRRVTQDFEVRAARFTLPADQVHGVYPPAGSTGVYDQLLPHVTVNRIGLPWEMLLDKPTDAGAPTWLAVLLFAPCELPGDPEAVGKVQTGTVDALLGSPDVAEHDMTVDADEKAVRCGAVDVPLDVFLRIAPTMDDLRRVAHVREGGDSARSVRQKKNPVNHPDTPADRHAVVIGNRFPSSTGGQYVAHLVSLEGYRRFVPKPGRQEGIGGQKPDGKTVLRLVSLCHWSFRSLPDTDTAFGALVERLAAPGRTGGKPNSGEKLGLRVPVGARPAEAAKQVAWDRLNRGYVPVSYRLPSGDLTFAWYRGPFSPVVPQPVPKVSKEASSADGWLIYQEKHGLFDVSYACAWTLGRLIALADPAFGTALMRWQSAARRRAGRVQGASGGGHGTMIGGGGVPAGSGHARLRELAQDSMKKLPSKLTIPKKTVDVTSAPGLDKGKQRAEAHKHPSVVAKAGAVTDWLVQLALLRQVPMDHLTPDKRMLPPESIRFGYLDRGWQRALLAGALSIGVASTWDEDLAPLLDQAMARVPATMSALLVRSALVPSWPALRVGMFQGNTVLKPTRADVVGADLLLVLVDGVVDKLTLAEPPQGLHFGYEVDHTPSGSVALRRLTGGGIGEQIRVDGEYQYLTGINSATYLTAGRVLDVDKLARDLGAKLKDNSAGGPVVDSAGLAIQMVKAAEQITFGNQGVRP